MKSYYFAAVRSWLLSLPSRERGLKYSGTCYTDGGNTVAPLAGAWIEILSILFYKKIREVAPLAGAWIEIPIRRKGGQHKWVAPLAGAWIEIFSVPISNSISSVAPLAGAWIEISQLPATRMPNWSLPSRERGLK